MQNTPNEFTHSGEPPIPRNVGEVVNAWEKTYRPKSWLEEQQEKHLVEYKKDLAYFDDVEYWKNKFPNPADKGEIIYIDTPKPKKQSFFTRLRTAF